MISKLYDSYKNRVLQALNSEGILDRIEVNNSTLRYTREDNKELFEGVESYTDYLSMLKYNSLSIAKEEVGKELLKEFFYNHCICMLNDVKLDTKGEITARDKAYVSLDSLKRLNYDFFGRYTTLEQGVIINYSSDFFSTDISFTTANSSMYLCLEDVDEDGIVVLPPYCSGIVFLNAELETKIKRVVMFTDSDASPVFVRGTKGVTVENFKDQQSSLVDMSDVEIDIYCYNSFRCINSKIDLSMCKSNNIDNLRVYLLASSTVHISSPRDSLDEVLLTLITDVKVQISTGPHSAKIKLKNRQEGKLKEVSLTDVNNDLYLIGEANEFHYGIVDVATTLCRYSTLECFFNGDFKADNFYLSINPNENSIIKLEETSLAKEYMVDKSQEIHSPYVSFINILKELESLTGINITILEKYSTLLCKPDNATSYTLDEYLPKVYLSLFLRKCISLTSDSIFSKLSDNCVTSVMEHLSKFFDTIVTSVGYIRLEQAIEMFSTGSNIKLVSWDKTNGRIGLETDSGLTASCSFIQYLILRSFGLYTTQCVNINCDDYKDGSVDSIVETDIMRDLKLKTSNTRFYSFILGIQDRELGRVYLGCNEMSYKLTINELMHSTDYVYIPPEFECKYGAFSIKCRVGRAKVTKKALSAIDLSIKESEFKYSHLQSIVNYIKLSSVCGLTGGAEVECLGVETRDIDKIATDIIMDRLYYKKSYTLYKLGLNGEICEVEEECLNNLLKSRKIVCKDLVVGLVDKKVIWAKTEYDKQFLDFIDELNSTNLLVYGDAGRGLVSVSYLSAMDGKYTLAIRGVSSIELPSFALSAYAKGITALENEFKNKGLDIKPIELDEVVVSDFYDLNCIQYLLQYGQGMRIMFNDDIVYSGGAVEIDNEIEDGEVWLPHNFEVNYTFDTSKVSKRSTLQVFNYKMHIRSGSVIKKATVASFVEIGDNCKILSNAFSSAVLKSVVLHSGEYIGDEFSDLQQLEKITIDGGHVVFNIYSFRNCSKLEEIECINGGSFEVLGLDNLFLLEVCSEDTLSPYVYRKIVEYSVEKGEEESKILNGIPVSIDSNGTCEFRLMGGESLKLDLEEAYRLYEKGKLNLTVKDKNGDEISFIKRIDDIDCLIFHPSVTDNLCNIPFYVIFNKEPLLKLNSFAHFKETPVILLLDMFDIHNGRITDFPYTLLGDGVGVYYAYVPNESGSALVFSFFSNLCYFRSSFRDWLDYETELSRWKPSVDSFQSNMFGNLYFPASHEIDYKGKRLDSSGPNKKIVNIGGRYKYGKKYKEVKNALTRARNLILTPGIGENCLVKIHPDELLETSSHSLWLQLNSLFIQTETFLEREATTYYTIQGTRAKTILGSNFEVSISNNTEMYLTSLPLNSIVVNQSAEVILNCDVQRNLTDSLLAVASNVGNKKSEICLHLSGKLYVENLTGTVFNCIISAGFYSLAYQLYNHCTEEAKKHLESSVFFVNLMEGVKNKNVIEEALVYHGLDERPLVAAKVYKESSIDVIDMGDKWETVRETKEEILAELEAPVRLEVSDESLNSAEIGAFDSDPNNQLVEEETEEEDDLEDTQVDSLLASTDNDILKVVADTCGVDLEDGVEDIIADVKRKRTISAKKKKEQEEAERIEAQEQQLGLLTASKEELDKEFKEAHPFMSSELKKVSTNTKKKYFKKFKEDKEQEKILKDKEDKEIESLEVLLSDNVLADRVKDRINTDYSKDLGLASGLMEKLVTKRVQSLEEKLQLLENRVNSSKEKLSVVAEVYKNNKLLGYKVIQETTGVEKKLSVESVQKLLLSNKYDISGVKLVDNVVVATLTLNMEEL